MPSAISGFTPTNTSATSTKESLNGMTSGDFLKLMIQQLQQQDPMNPTDSNQLLTQMSQISTLQSNTQMQQNLQSMTLQQAIGSAGNLIGKMILGIDESGNALQGLVTSVKVADKKVRLELDSGHDLPMENVTQVSTASAAALAKAVSSGALPQTSNSGTTGSSAVQPLASDTGTASSILEQLIPSWTTMSTSQLTNLASALKALQGVSGS